MIIFPKNKVSTKHKKYSYSCARTVLSPDKKNSSIEKLLLMVKGMIYISHEAHPAEMSMEQNLSFLSSYTVFSIVLCAQITSFRQWTLVQILCILYIEKYLCFVGKNNYNIKHIYGNYM